MRVLIVAPWRAAIVQRMVSALKKQGVEVILASHDATGQQGVIDLGPLNSFWDYFKVGRLKKLIVELNPDLIHAHYATHYGVMAALQWKVPFVIALWGSDVLYSALNLGKGRVAFLKLLLKFVMRRAAICHSSSQQVCEEAKKIAGLRRSRKFQFWFWGVIPNQLRTPPLPEEIELLRSEYNLPERIILSGRGVADIYRPELVSEIIKRCSQAVTDEKGCFVILRGNASTQEVERFKKSLIGFEKSYIIINRMLNDKELAYLYNLSIAHLSIPKSDSLGGGVVEPAMCGSYPILSDLPGNQWFAENYVGTVLAQDTAEIYQQAERAILNRLKAEKTKDTEKVDKVVHDFSEAVVIKKIITMYSQVSKLRE